MTTQEMTAAVAIGSEWLLPMSAEAGALRVRVVVRDLRESWGRLQARVEPVAGEGSVWVEASRLRPVASGTSSQPALSVVCSWCQGQISGPSPSPGVPVSHGICSGCAAGVRGSK